LVLGFDGVPAYFSFRSKRLELNGVSACICCNINQGKRSIQRTIMVYPGLRNDKGVRHRILCLEKLSIRCNDFGL
jgi:hypothetical protein